MTSEQLFPEQAFYRGLRRIRKDRGLSLGELAERVGVTVSHLSQIERAKRNPSVELLRRLAEILEAPMKELL